MRNNVLWRKCVRRLRRLRGSVTDLVRESADGVWGGSWNLGIRGSDNLRAPQPAILTGPRRCKLCCTRVKIYQECLEPATTASAKRWRDSWFALTSRTPHRRFSPSRRVLALLEDLAVFAGNREWIERVNLGLGRVLGRGEPLVFVILEIAVGQISVAFCRFFVANFFLVEVIQLGLFEVPESGVV